MMADLRLYELPYAFRQFDRDLEEAGGELSPDMLARLDALEAAPPRKVDAICALISEHNAAADAFEAESRRLSERARAQRSAADRLKSYLLANLIALGRDKVKGERFVASVREAAMPKIAWPGSLNDAPAEFLRVETSVHLNYDRAVAAYKAGTLPDGFITNITKYLNIR
jgi:hypothetical protein